MSCPAFFTNVLALRQPSRHYTRTTRIASPTSFTVFGFRIDSTPSQYQTLVSEIRNQEQFPFTMAPTLDIDNDARPPRKKAKLVDNAPKLHCRICYSELTDEEFWIVPCRTCKKPTCFECVKGQWLAALSDHERMPVRCCQKVVYHDAAKDILPSAELAIYKLRSDEASTPNPFYCPVPTCSTFIPPRLLKPVRGKITCHICATTSCVKCRQPASDEHKCLNVDEKTAILKSFNYKLCPKCGTGIMRMYGCAHVRCQCGAHWCWDCHRPINACYAKPCSAARDDGQNSEPDDADSESDEEAATSITDTVSAPNANEPASTGTMTQTNNQAEASNPGSHGPPSAPTVVVEIADWASPVTNNNPAGVSQEEQRPPQETVLNLDDPENPDRDWEGEDFDFGDYPNPISLTSWFASNCD